MYIVWYLCISLGVKGLASSLPRHKNKLHVCCIHDFLVRPLVTYRSAA